MAMEMLGGLSTRRYPLGLEPVGNATETAARSTSKSAVSRKFVAMTERTLSDLLGADLSELDLVAIMIDGVHFVDQLCVVALGIDIDGTKHPSALAAQALLEALAPNSWTRPTPAPPAVCAKA